jgi:ArsR family transcriptional regulator, lead/cadmium/zinc/bismuth-responsive transcriptional repressor
MLDRDLYSAEAAFFRALGDETRLRILSLLRNQGEQNVSELCQGIDKDQSTISHHLACLRNCGLVKTRKEGKSIIYALNSKDKISKILSLGEGHVQDAVEGILTCEVVR